MYRIKIFFKLTFLCLLFLANTVSANDSSIRVVTSFSILEDLVKELGGQYVSVVNLVGRNSDAHMYQPKPSDAVAIAKADLVVFNGLGFEGWIPRLIKNSGYKNQQIIASRGVDAIKNGKEIDPHAWQSFHNIRLYIQNISQMLIQLRPQHVEALTKRQQKYLDSVSNLEQRLKKQFASIPPNKRIVVTSHDAFGYLGREFKIQFLAPLGLSLEVEASAEDVAAIIDQIREQSVKALFVENINNPRLLELISAETNVTIGGRLYSDALSEVEGPASTYLKMMRYNIESLINRLNTH
ncbi:zinc ABC transporter substrate-binding protein [Candidatus Poribacteria bacterium]|nr:zinc ABC transporter substrate-binding protein [Candidatus Poribacteria bacterium]|tara:strand:+ start:1500 stop:2387 length:888 start_codon:yes stop_codon:yes gene_type:complete